MANKKKAPKTPAQRAIEAKVFFANTETMGPWLVQLMADGWEGADDGRCDVQAENPEDARHARALTKEEYCESIAKGLALFFQSRAGKRELAKLTDVMYEAFTEDRDDEEGDENA